MIYFDLLAYHRSLLNMKSLIILVLVFIRAFLCTSENLDYKDDLGDKKSFLERIMRMIKTDSTVTTSITKNLPNLATTTVWPNLTTSFSTTIPGITNLTNTPITTSETATSPSSPLPPPFINQQCANYSKSNFESRCIACEPAKPGEYPWQVELVVGSNSPLCGGSLITSKLVLTAAHCADINNFLDIVTVKLGHIDRNEGHRQEKTVMSKVSRKFIHPDYNGYKYNDIAMLELENSVEMSDTIQPACIADYKNIEIDIRKGTVVTSGWGSTVECTSVSGSDCNTPDILQGTEMFLLSRKLCNKHIEEALGTDFTPDIVTEKMICANDHSRVCRGDSGGGLIKDVEGKATIIGIVSWGLKGCPVGRPAVYTNVAKFSNWIEKIISDTNIVTTTSTTTISPATSESTTPSIPPSPPPPFLDQQCANFSTTITQAKCIGCDPAKRGQYPWQAELRINSSFVCGGVLISSKLVLTAAHCVTIRKGPTDTVVLGQIDRSVEEPEKVITKVSKTFIHPYYARVYYPILVPSNNSSNSSTTQYPMIRKIQWFEVPSYDAAIVELEESIEISDSIRPACISTDYDQINTGSGTVVTSGWGSIVECARPHFPCKIPNVLQGTEMFLISRQICNKHILEELQQSDTGNDIDIVIDGEGLSMICANDHSRVCKGDSGGGLIKNIEGKATVIGLTSWGASAGPKACPLGRPAVYTNVANAEISKWIEEIMNYNA